VQFASGAVLHYPTADHNPCPLSMLHHFALSVHSWLQARLSTPLPTALSVLWPVCGRSTTVSVTVGGRQLYYVIFIHS
jgi:hypothetical protein